jgi:hypothetical protein
MKAGEMRISVLMITAAAICVTNTHAADDVVGWQVNWDNDAWGKGKTDRWYTNGIRISWTYDQLPTFVVGKLFLDGSEWFLWRDVVPTLSYSFGQTMYTPKGSAIRAETEQDLLEH